MQPPTVHTASTLPTAHAPVACGHTTHVGACPACQRAQLGRWRVQLAEATAQAARAANRRNALAARMRPTL